MKFLKALLVLALLMGVGLGALKLAHPLPDRSGVEAGAAIAPSPDTRLGAAILALMAEHPGQSGVVPLVDGRDALSARILMARAAEASIDVQYYIWQTDTTGWLLLDEVRTAADRGVRVRLLLDDNGIPGLDDVLAALHAHPMIEVRLFNPFTLRQPKLLSYGFDFFRLNRRMHNKSMTVDGVATILGGRNIGDIYFAFGPGTAYFDLDVLGVGPIAADVAMDFDRYWNSASAYPADMILGSAPRGLDQLADASADARQGVAASDYLAAIGASALVARVMAGDPILEWTEVTLMSDDPAKGLGQAGPGDLLMGQLGALLEEVETSLDVVSAYLIPGRAGTDLFAGLAAEGRAVRLLTNSLSATDVPVVHSAWMNYRSELLDAGVRIFELRARADEDRSPDLSAILIGSSSSLHAKTFAIDGQRIFVGSFNFDPRSAMLNTEMGVVIESPRIAVALSQALDARDMVYEVVRSNGGSLVWRELTPGGEDIVHTTEPHASLFRRALTRAASWLPVEWIL
jgi:putative cardiolipin synthase